MTNQADINLKTRDAYSSWATCSIRFSDLDPNGHVNNGAINAFFEDGRVQFRTDRMVSLGDGILSGFVLVKFSVEYLKVLHYPGSVDVGTVVTKVGNTSFVLGQSIFSGDNCIAVAEVITVSLNSDTQKSQPIEGALRDVLEAAQRYS
jgi:acyl-CoA thioester hydrolase